MIPIKQLKSVLSSTKRNNNSVDFFTIHRYVEGYLKRVFLIGLRLNGVQYENSVKIVDVTYLNTRVLIQKVLMLLDGTGGNKPQTISKFKKTHFDKSIH